VTGTRGLVAQDRQPVAGSPATGRPATGRPATGTPWPQPSWREPCDRQPLCSAARDRRAGPLREPAL